MWHQRLRFTVLLCSGLVPELGLFAPFREFRNARFLSPPDWVTYGGALGVAPWNPSLHLRGAIGQFFTLGAAYEEFEDWRARECSTMAMTAAGSPSSGSSGASRLRKGLR
jgi:hypothetical protein